MTREERFKMDMIDEFKLMCEIVGNSGRIIVNKHRMLKALEQEPRKGHWIPRNSFLVPYKCSECNYESERYDNFCPNCGAKMIEPQESEAQDADSN